jgi:hypothetical protein
MLNIYRTADGDVKYRLIPKTPQLVPLEDVVDINLPPIPRVLQPGQQRFEKWVHDHEELLYICTRYIEDQLRASLVHDTRFYMAPNAVARAFSRYAFKTSRS